MGAFFMPSCLKGDGAVCLYKTAAYFIFNEKRGIVMTKEELKAMGLTDEQADKIAKDYENYVPKAEYDQQATALKQAKEEQKRIAKELDTLKKNNANNEELTKQIEQMKADADKRQKDYDATIKQMKLDAAVDKSLLTAKAKNTKAVKALLDLVNADVDDDGNVKGLDDQLKKLKKSDAYLFEPDKPQHKMNGLKPGEGGDGPDGGQEMTDQQIFEQALNM